MYLRLDEKPKNKLAIVEDSGGSYSYGDLVAFTREVREWLPERTLVMILCRNTIATIAMHAATVENRIVPFMCAASMDPALRDNLIAIYQPEYLWLPQEMVPEFKSFAPVKEKWGYTLMRTVYPAPELYEDLSLLLTTSGSTGSPKLVRHSYENLISNAENVASVFNFGPDDRSLIDLQLHYTMGLNVACSSLFAGATLAMTTHNAMEDIYWDFFRAQKISNITGVPYSYEILKRMRFFKEEHPSLRIIAEGGGKLTDSMFRFIAEYARDHGKEFFATFGTSETTSRLAFLPPSLALEHIGSIGKAIPGGELFLVDEEKNVIAQAEAEGELAYRGRNVTLGYAMKKDDLKNGDERQGVYYTGDLARRDADGFYYIVGRKSRFLKLYGHRVGLDESEQLIRQKFNLECACAGNDKAMRIYLTDEGVSQAVRHFLADALHIPIQVFLVTVLPSIPKNEVGKIRYSELPKEN